MAEQQNAEPDPGRTPAGLYREHCQALRRFLLGLLRHSADAEDALQQVFLRLVQNWERIAPATARGWLFTVAYHEAMAVRRRQQAEHRWAALQVRPVWLTTAEDASPMDIAVATEDAAKLRRALQGLPAEQREVVERRLFRNEKFAEMAARLRCPLGTVLTRMRSALTKLRRALEE